MAVSITPTDEQRNVIDYPESLVVIARPGSGKTVVMAEKIRSTLPTLPSYRGVIAISYTNKASDELKRRALLDTIDIKRSFFGTIDRFCLNEIIIPFLPHLWGRPPREVQIDRIGNLRASAKRRFLAIRENNVSMKTLEEHLEEIRALFEEGILLLEMNGALALFVIQKSLACRKYLRARYTHIFVDEYQDSGLEQHELFLTLQDLGLVAIAVGDVEQAIFRFSGKESKYLLDLASRSTFSTFPITRNHRSHPSITDYSLRLFDAKSEPSDVDASYVYDVRVNGKPNVIATWIDRNLGLICECVAVTKMANVGILVRSNHTGEIINNTLRSKHRFFRSLSLEEQSGSWGRIFSRLLRYHFDRRFTAQEVIDEFGSPMLSSQDVRRCRKLIKLLRKPDLPTVSELEAVAKRLRPEAASESSVELLLNTLEDQELLRTFIPPVDDEVQIMTLHKAKGMEFDIVFHLDLYEWVLPRKAPGPGDDWDNCQYPDWQQDLNLHYVGVTRARKCCLLCTSTRRINSRNEDKPGTPSEFLSLSGVQSLRVNVNEVLRGLRPEAQDKLSVALRRRGVTARPGIALGGRD